MIVNTVKYLVKPGTRDEVMRLSAEVREYARSLPGNIDYCPTASPYRENEVVSFEKWESMEALQAYMDSEACKSFQAARNQYLEEGSMEAEVYEATLHSRITY